MTGEAANGNVVKTCGFGFTEYDNVSLARAAYSQNAATYVRLRI